MRNNVYHVSGVSRSGVRSLWKLIWLALSGCALPMRREVPGRVKSFSGDYDECEIWGSAEIVSANTCNLYNMIG
jgi:hypothetical protein